MKSKAALEITKLDCLTQTANELLHDLPRIGSTPVMPIQPS
jgi:hypothetical protein